MIHGGAVSDGCLPIGDAAIEEIFALVDRVGTENVPVIVSPLDFRRADPRRAEARAAGACDNGATGGCYTLARLAEDGGDTAGAVTLYARACQRGYPSACERDGAGAPRTIAVSR